MRVNLFLLTVITDAGGSVIAEHRDPLPPQFPAPLPQHHAPEPVRGTTAQSFDPDTFQRVSEQSVTYADGRTETFRTERPSLPDTPTPEKEPTLKTAPTAEKTPMQAAVERLEAQARYAPAIPLMESDPEVLAMFGQGVQQTRSQQVRPVLETAPPES